MRELVDSAHKVGLTVMMDIVFFHCGPDSVLLERPGFVKRTAAGKPVLGQWGFPAFELRKQRVA